MEGIREHQTVVGSDGEHVGTVDGVDGGRIKFTRKDPDLHGLHHYLRGEFIDAVEGDTVRLNIPASEARANLQTT
ncbi:DUF2171 domain-containing protein [bacterium]|nr:MAG: DUF2171 domain-containing protein [bacterium]